MAPANVLAETYFYPRPLRGGRPLSSCSLSRTTEISIHALCEEGDLRMGVSHLFVMQFLSTPSARRATAKMREKFSICAISIHALCEEGDQTSSRLQRTFWYFYPRPLRGGRRHGQDGERRRVVISIHALCEEGDITHQHSSSGTARFLSTPSARRATCAWFGCVGRRNHFYPRPLRGGRLSVTSPRCTPHKFLSTPSARRATRRGHRRFGAGRISIHALCEEGDRR